MDFLPEVDIDSSKTFDLRRYDTKSLESIASNERFDSIHSTERDIPGSHLWSSCRAAEEVGNHEDLPFGATAVLQQAQSERDHNINSKDRTPNNFRVAHHISALALEDQVYVTETETIRDRSGQFVFAVFPPKPRYATFLSPD